MAENSLAPSQPKFSIMMQQPKFQDLVNQTLGDPDRARRFVASVSSAVATTPTLQQCDAGSILTGALLGESLNLHPSPQLGHFYLVPYNKKVKPTNGPEYTAKFAQFQMGYKGYIQLAIRSGQYKKLNVLAIKEGEFLGYNPLEEELKVRFIEDEYLREQAKTVGYFAMFELVSGFRKAMYWNYDKMAAHADRYSPAFKLEEYKNLLEGKIPAKDMWKYSSFWYKNFDEMAGKTMIRQLIPKWGPMSIDFQTAFENDTAILCPDKQPEYIELQEEPELLSESIGEGEEPDSPGPLG